MRGFGISAKVLVTVIIFIVTITLFYNLFTVEKTQASLNYQTPKYSTECKTNSDCSTNINGQICFIINTHESFCGCFNDAPDCFGARKCIFNRCEP